MEYKVNKQEVKMSRIISVFLLSIFLLFTRCEKNQQQNETQTKEALSDTLSADTTDVGEEEWE
jgi:hypothetical protein